MLLYKSGSKEDVTPEAMNRRRGKRGNDRELNRADTWKGGEATHAGQNQPDSPNPTADTGF
jgi:hypothetical protein